MKFGAFLYDDVEPIDLAPFGVLSMARWPGGSWWISVGPRDHAANHHASRAEHVL